MSAGKKVFLEVGVIRESATRKSVTNQNLTAESIRIFLIYVVLRMSRLHACSFKTLKWNYEKEVTLNLLFICA